MAGPRIPAPGEPAAAAPRRRRAAAQAGKGAALAAQAPADAAPAAPALASVARRRSKPSPQPSAVRRIVAGAVGIASAAGVGMGLAGDVPGSSSAARALILPTHQTTPGVIDPTVHAPDICQKVWATGDLTKGEPPHKGGNLTYSQAARNTSTALKNRIFDDYAIVNPRDGGKSYEIDHLVPLALGGRDVEQNLWPQSRVRGTDLNAWDKDRLESRLYHLMCHADPGDPKVDLAQIQAALRTDWTKAYQTWCGDDDGCQASDSQTD